MFRNYRKLLGTRNRGQTALEYALVVGVIAVGVIYVAQKVFVGNGQEPSAAEKVMQAAVDQAQNAVTGK
ncbi:MAG TPA: hypothetical protein VI895_00140 [Bdellovibrionota bacterium]|nr:hypothetical protein [Bdellovibrionota bacterium]